MQEVDTVAPSDLTVLILGETGTGKELVAHRLHEGSRRSHRPLVQVNCAALPETLADSELFGHRRGAFTGATQDRMGKFEMAAGGTLMLDEVGELPLPVQAKLLRVLQSGDIQRPGSDAPLRVDVRVVAATNRDLRGEVAAGRFRADLYHRLAVYPVHVPPLRARGRDVLALAGAFLEENQHRLGARNLRLSPASREALLHHDWPGNVRELEHLISRAALRAWTQADGRTQRWTPIEPDHLGLWPERRQTSTTADTTTHTPSGPIDSANTGSAFSTPSIHRSTAENAIQSAPVAPTLREATEAFQREWLQALLQRHPHSMASAAREAGMDRSNFHRLIRKWGLSGGRR
jgi:anaerobic nitric oxide reductase transcription regulator